MNFLYFNICPLLYFSVSHFPALRSLVGYGFQADWGREIGLAQIAKEACQCVPGACPQPGLGRGRLQYKQDVCNRQGITFSTEEGVHIQGVFSFIKFSLSG